MALIEFTVPESRVNELAEKKAGELVKQRIDKYIEAEKAKIEEKAQFAEEEAKFKLEEDISIRRRSLEDEYITKYEDIAKREQEVEKLILSYEIKKDKEVLEEMALLRAESAGKDLEITRLKELLDVYKGLVMKPEDAVKIMMAGGYGTQMQVNQVKDMLTSGNLLKEENV